MKVTFQLSSGTVEELITMKFDDIKDGFAVIIHWQRILQIISGNYTNITTSFRTVIYK